MEINRYMPNVLSCDFSVELHIILLYKRPRANSITNQYKGHFITCMKLYVCHCFYSYNKANTKNWDFSIAILWQDIKQLHTYYWVPLKLQYNKLLNE